LGPVSTSPFKHTFVSLEKERPNFPEIYQGRGGEKPLSPSRGVRSRCSGAAEKGEIVTISITSHPWHRGGLSIMTITKIRTISTITTVIYSDPLIV
jgi:hypothetical protein